jgi:hypothetical protein
MMTLSKPLLKAWGFIFQKPSFRNTTRQKAKTFGVFFNLFAV